MNSTKSTEPGTSAERRTFAVDVAAARMGRDGFDAFRHAWDVQIGGSYPLPPFAPGATGAFRVSVQASRVCATR